MGEVRAKPSNCLQSWKLTLKDSCHSGAKPTLLPGVSPKWGWSGTAYEEIAVQSLKRCLVSTYCGPGPALGIGGSAVKGTGKSLLPGS